MDRDAPDCVTLRLVPFNARTHKMMVLSGLNPRIECKCATRAGLREVFRSMAQHTGKSLPEEEVAGLELHLAAELSSSAGGRTTWTEQASSSVLIKDVYLAAEKRNPLFLSYYWDAANEVVEGQKVAMNVEEVSKSEAYESLIQFLASIVSGVLQQMKKKRKRKQKDHLESVAGENSEGGERPATMQPEREDNKDEESKGQSASKKLSEEDIDLQMPFKCIFEKSRQSRGKEDSRLMCDELLADTIVQSSNSKKPAATATATAAAAADLITPKAEEVKRCRENEGVCFDAENNSDLYIPPTVSAVNSLAFPGLQHPAFANSNPRPLPEITDSLQLMYGQREHMGVSQQIPVLQDPAVSLSFAASNQFFASRNLQQNMIMQHTGGESLLMPPASGNTMEGPTGRLRGW